MTLKQMLFGLVLISTLGACNTTMPVSQEIDQKPLDLRNGQVVSIRSAYTAKCMDVANGSTTVGNWIVQFGCHGQTNQQFVLDSVVAPIIRFRNVNSNLCVAATGYQGYSTPRMNLVQSTCNSAYANFTLENLVTSANSTTATLRWAYDSAYCVDVPSGAAIDSLILQIYPCHGGQNQRWIIR